jgi:hypothetical protein
MAGVSDQSLIPMGYQKLTPTTSTALTVPAGSRFAMINIETTTAYLKDDGTAVVSGSGLALKDGTNYWYTGDLALVRLIQATGAVHVLYYR